jgi:hypothetical protein
MCRSSVRIHQVERAVRGASGAAGRGLLHHRRDHHGEGCTGSAQHRDRRAYQRDRASRPVQRPLLLHRRHQPRHRQVPQRRQRVDTTEIFVGVRAAHYFVVYCMWSFGDGLVGYRRRCRV